MTESAVADFAASFSVAEKGHNTTTRGRVLLSQKHLVLAADDETDVKIPLSTVVDIKVKDIPSELEGFFDDAVRIAYERNDNPSTVVIMARKKTIEKFSIMLFKTSLNETDMMIKHPARVGGQVTDQEFIPATLSLESKAARFTRGGNCIRVEVSTVADLSRLNTELAGSRCHGLKIQHVRNGQTMTTTTAIDTSRKMSLLRRYFQLRYSDWIADLTDVEVSSDGKQVLAAIHSGGNSEDLSCSAMVEKKPQEITMLLNKLRGKELIVDTAEATKLTHKGSVIVNDHLEDTA